jgi:hypothetical protein
MQVIPRCPLSDRLYLVVRYIWIFINPVIVLPIFLLAFMFVIGRLFLSGSEYVQICYRLYIYITVNPVINGSGILINRLAPSLWCVYPNVITSWSLFMFSEFIWQVVVRFYRYWWNCCPSHISTISGKKRQPYCRTFLWRHIFSDLFKNVLIIRLTWQVYYKRQELLLSSVLRCLLRF